MTIDAIRQSQEEAVRQASPVDNGRAAVTHGPCSRRQLLVLAAGGSLLAGAGLARAEAEAQSESQPAAAAADPAVGESGVVLDPIALAILHEARGAASWSSRPKLRSYLKTAGANGVLGSAAAATPAARLFSPDARAISATWQSYLLAAGNVFQRAREFQKLVGLMDAYAARVLSAERYFVPLGGQGFLSYDDLDENLLNDAGLVEAGSRFAATRFATLERDALGALQVMNLHVQQLSPSLKAPAELYRVNVPDTELAERLLTGKAGTVQLLEVQLRGETPRCFPRAEPMKGTPRPLPALAVEFSVIDASSGNKLYSKPIGHRLRQGKKGYCSVA